MWQMKSEEKEDIKLLHLYYKARKFNENYLVKKAYFQWCERYNNIIEYNVSVIV